MSFDEDKLNMQVRKFLKKVGITSQREIEKTMQELDRAGRLPAERPMEAVVILKIEALGIEERIDGTLEF